MIWLMAILAVAHESDVVERQLASQCGIDVPRHAKMSYAGDLWRVLYDKHLTAEQLQCLTDWAENWPKAGAIVPWRVGDLEQLGVNGD